MSFLFIGTTEKTLIEVLTQRSNAQRQLIAKAYEKATGRVSKCTFKILSQSVVTKTDQTAFHDGGVRSMYRSTFLHQTLVADLEGDTHGDFEDLLVALVTPPAVYDCQEVINAIKVRLCRIKRICTGLLMLRQKKCLARSF